MNKLNQYIPKSDDLIKLDDLIESKNHFKLFDYMLDNVDNLLTKDMIIEMNKILKRNTSDEENPRYNAGGFKVNSKRTIDFRLWATNILNQYSVKGYVLDKERLKNGTFLNENYFDELLQEIREIRISERNFYQKITDIYSTSLDYNVASPTTKDFLKQSKIKCTM